MLSVAFWFQSPETWPAVVLMAAAASLLGLTGMVVVQLRRQVQAAWAETGRIYQRSADRFSSVGDLVDGILFETDATRTLTYTNQAFHALTGFRERDLRSGLSLNDLFEPEERRRLLEDLETEPDTREVRVRSLRLRRRDGAAVPVSMRMTTITDRERLVGWRGVLAPLPEPSHGAGAVEKVLGGILREFNETPAEEHQEVLSRGLAEIGRLLGADRCYHYHRSGDGESLVSLRQWYAPGVSPMSGDDRLPPLASYPWSLDRLRDDGALVVADVQSLDAAEVPERGRWLRQGITSLLVVPLRRERAIVGVLGCETLGRARQWGPRDRQVLEAMAEICQRVQGDDRAAQRLVQANERAVARQEEDLARVRARMREFDVPVGAGLDATGRLAARSARLERSYRDGLMSRSDFEGFLAEARDSSALIAESLRQTAELVADLDRAAGGTGQNPAQSVVRSTARASAAEM